MTYRRYSALILPLVMVIALAGALVAQDAPPAATAAPAAPAAAPGQTEAPASLPTPAPEKVFLVNGRQIPGSLVQLAGRYYVSIEALTQITNGTMSMDATRIMLNLPAAPATAESAAGPADDTMTRAFIREAVSDLADMREWKAAMATVVQFGVPVVGSWPDDYANRVQDDVTRAKLAAVTGADLNALGLLQGEAGNLSAWSADVVTSRNGLNAARSVDPNALANDALYRKIDGCSQFLNGMIGSGIFSDDSRCH